MADDKVRASSSSSSLFTLNLPNGLGGERTDREGSRETREPSQDQPQRGKPWQQPQAGRGEMGGGWEWAGKAGRGARSLARERADEQWR